MVTAPDDQMCAEQQSTSLRALQSSEVSLPWQTEHIGMDDEGLVFFDGGTYSQGPVSLVQPPAFGGVQTGHSSEKLPEQQQHHDILPESWVRQCDSSSYLAHRWILLHVE